MREDRLLLEDMLERIRLTEEFVQAGREEFFKSRLIQEAVIRNLEIIGEASRSLSEAARENNPDVPWRQIGAFRNFVIHVYWGIKPERVWEIVENDLPPLKQQVEAMLAALDTAAGDIPTEM